MTQQSLFRLRVRYGKRGRLAYLGHLELIHTIERTVRRASLPYAVTQGFSPRMRVAFTSALPVGTSSCCEWYDVVLTELIDPKDALERLRGASPADLAPDCAAYVDMRTPALTAQITRIDYRVSLRFALGNARSCEDITGALAQIRSMEGIDYLRGKKAKRLDLTRTLISAEAIAAERGGVDILLNTRCDNEGSLRPEILLAALDQLLRGLEVGEEPIVSTGIQDLASIERYEVERVGQWIEDLDGSLRDPLG